LATQPCNCGYHGHPTIPCRCPPAHIERYRRRISGPLLDRIELRVELQPPTLDELSPSVPARATNGASCLELRARIEHARELQAPRQGERRNVDLSADELDRFAPLDGTLRSLLSRIARQRNLSARAVQSLRRVARTLADLDGSAQVASEHMAQAIALRSPIL
jgi:magnesium chelatase family protein